MEEQERRQRGKQQREEREKREQRRQRKQQELKEKAEAVKRQLKEEEEKRRRRENLDRCSTLRSAVKLAFRHHSIIHSTKRSQVYDLVALNKTLCSQRISLGDLGQHLLLEMIKFIDGAGHQACLQIQDALSRLTSSEDALLAAQNEINSMIAISEEAEQMFIAPFSVAESLAGVVQGRNAARRLLVEACREFLATRREHEIALLTQRELLDELLDRFQSYLSMSPVSASANGQRSDLSSSFSGEELRKQLVSADSDISIWVQSVNDKLSCAWEQRLMTARVYADGLRQVASMLDGSDGVLEDACLEDKLPEAHMALEKTLIAEELLLSDESLVQSFPSDSLISALHCSVEWLQELSFKLDQFRSVEAVQADLDALLNLRDPEPLITERSKLKQEIDDLDEELMDAMHDLAKCRRRNLPKDDVEEKIRMIKDTIRNRASKLEQIDGELWNVVGHCPEYKGALKQEVKELVGSSDDDSVGLFTSYDSLELYEVERPLSVLGQQGARHHVLLVKQGKERFVIKEFDLTDDRKDRKRFVKEVSMLHHLAHPYLVKLCSAFFESRTERGRNDAKIKGYLKMPYLEGGTLWSWVQTMRPSEQQKHRVLLQILQGLEHLRQNRIIHCDIKPANILMSSLSADAEPRIADFDVSKEQEDRTRDLIATITTSTYVAGTWNYMAPELRETPSTGSRRVSHKSDMYSFGIVMVEFLKEKQWEGAGNEALDALVTDLGDYAKDLSLKILDSDPCRRYSSAEALTHPYFTHSMIKEREDLDREQMKMRIDHDRQMAELVNSQDRIAEEEQALNSKIEALRLEERQLLAEQERLVSKGEQMEQDAKVKREQLQKQKEELSRQERSLKKQQQDLHAQVQGLSKEELRLERERQKVEMEKLLISQDRVVLKPPLYWQQNSPNGLKQVRIDVTREWKDEIQQLMDSTCKAQYIGQGRDNRGLNHKGYKVERVYRIENKEHWCAYALNRRSTGFWGASQQGNRHPTTIVSTWRDWMKHRLHQDKGSNEVFLFHGTRPDLVNVIAESGLDERVCSLGGLFGAGIYLAENSSKSDEYCTPDVQGLCSMFLVRAVLGTPYEALEPRNNSRRPPCMPRADQRLYDSVIGVMKQTHPRAFLEKYREFIVYDRNQVYPEFLIHFRRV